MKDRLNEILAKNRNMVILTAAGVVTLIVVLCFLCCGRETLDSGSSNGLVWTYYSDGTLEFIGEGDVVGMEFSYTESGSDIHLPEWYDYRAQVTNIDVDDSVASVGMDAFVDFTSLERLTVRGKDTLLDMDCIRFEQDWSTYESIVIRGRDGSAAQEYAVNAGLKFKLL